MKLNSFDDWSPLREVILGSAVNYTSHERELSFELFFYDQMTDQRSIYGEMYYPRLRPPSTDTTSYSMSGRSPIKQRYVDELNEDIEGMAAIFKSLSITVHRPLTLAQTSEVRTPVWSAAVVPPLNVRDNTLILGDEIIETSPQVRARYFETQ